MVDVTVAAFAPTQLRFFGVALGMTHEEARRVLSESRVAVVVEDDTANPGRLYIYERTPNGDKGASLLYLIWEPSDPALARVTVFHGAAPYLHGDTRQLLTEAALDPQSPIGQRLGKPDRSAVTLDISMIGLKHTTYLYAARGLLLTHQVDKQLGTSKVVFAFALPSYGLH